MSAFVTVIKAVGVDFPFDVALFGDKFVEFGVGFIR